MYRYICVYIHYTYMYIYTYIHTYVYTQINGEGYTYIHTFTYMYTYIPFSTRPVCNLVDVHRSCVICFLRASIDLPVVRFAPKRPLHARVSNKITN